MRMHADPHLLAVIQQQGKLAATSPSGVAAQQAQAELAALWADVAPGQLCRLSPRALAWVLSPTVDERGHVMVPAPPPEDSPCRIWTIDPARNLAQVMVPIEHRTFSHTVAVEVTRAEILPTSE